MIRRLNIMDMKQGLKILVLTDFFFPDAPGGANKMAFFTSRGLVERGHHVSLITRRTGPESPDHENIEGIAVYRYDLPRKTFYSFNSIARPQIRKILNGIEKGDSRPLDLIIMHQPMIAIEGITHPFFRQTPWIYNFHSPWGEEFMISQSAKWLRHIHPIILLKKKIRDWIEGKVLRRCQKIIVLSQFMKKRLEKIHGLSQKSRIIPGGVNTQIFRPPEDQHSLRRRLGLPIDETVLFTVRNLRRRMGLINLIRAMAVLGDMGERIHLVIAGQGELEGKLKDYAKKSGIQERITFTGYLSEDDLPKFYQAADLFILPTEYLEGFGMVTLEAIASGDPVIATPVGATPEILKQIGREWLCSNSSSQALAAKMRERLTWMMQNPEGYKRMRGLCRDLAVHQYAWPRIIDEWEDACKDVIQLWKDTV